MEDEIWESESIRDAVTDEDRFGLSGHEKPSNHPIEFLKGVKDDTQNVKTANLTNDEVGIARVPVRTNLDLSNFCHIMGMQGLSQIFALEAQNTLGTSLSRDAKLINLAVTQKKQTETELKRRGQNLNKRGGLFGGGKQNLENNNM